MSGNVIWWIFWIVAVIVFIWLILSQIKSRKKSINNLNSSQKTPLDILNEKYAKHEISKEEYEGKKKDLE